MVRRNRYIFENVIEVEEYLDGRYGAPSERRQKKRTATKEQMEKVNQWNKSKKARHKLRKYFEAKKDWFVTLTCTKENRPADLKEMQARYKKFYEFLGPKFKKAGHTLRWIRNIENTPTNNWHIHVVISDLPGANIIALMNQAWPYGRVMNIQQLYEKGEFKSLADYVTKSEKTKKEYVEKGVLDHKITESNYSTSRNMPLPEPEVERLDHWEEEVKAPEGYYIEKETFYEGTNKFTGYSYRHYVLVKIKRRC